MDGVIEPTNEREKQALKQGLAFCGRVLSDIYNDYRSEEFRQPVDWNYLQIFDYPTIVKTPMDLGSVRRKLSNKGYTSIYDFNEDMQLVWNNAQLYNQPGSPIHEIAVLFQNMWQEKFERLQLILRTSEDLHKEKHQFLEILKKLNPDQLGHVVDMIQKQCGRAISQNEGTEHIQIEVNDLDVKTLRMLLQYCENCHDQVSKKKKRKTCKPKTPPAAAPKTVVPAMIGVAPVVVAPPPMVPPPASVIAKPDVNPCPPVMQAQPQPSPAPVPVAPAPPLAIS